AVEHRERLAALAFLERLADADNRRELRAKHRADLAVHERIGLVKIAPPLGVADDYVLGACFLQHRRGDLARERALTLPMNILPCQSTPLHPAACGRRGIRAMRHRPSRCG